MQPFTGLQPLNGYGPSAGLRRDPFGPILRAPPGVRGRRPAGAETAARVAAQGALTEGHGGEGEADADRHQGPGHVEEAEHHRRHLRRRAPAVSPRRGPAAAGSSLFSTRRLARLLRCSWPRVTPRRRRAGSHFGDASAAQFANGSSNEYV